MKILIVFILAVALPLATAFNCTRLDGEDFEICTFIENTDWPQKEKDLVIEDLLGSSMEGNFESELDKEIIDPIQLNKLKESEKKIEEENKEFLLDISSISIFFYFIYCFLKKYFLGKLI
jgi:hypothetical protein